MKLKLVAFFIINLLVVGFSLSQVTPNINSGDPAFPFPQFLDYKDSEQTLASQNSPGVPHAEMEQRMREAWRLVCNNTSPFENVTVAGVRYIYPNPNAVNDHCTCAEGDGYYLLAAALMGDKEYFDGYYMWNHDRSFNGVKRFIDGVENPYGNYARGLSYAGSKGSPTGVFGASSTTGNSATDGDVDIALALLIAYRQWGENSGIVLNDNGWGGKEISYKEEALKYITAMVDTAIFPLSGVNHTSGVVGLDGYLKGGDSQGELTRWAVDNGYLGMTPEVNQQDYFYDYSAPAWFKQFRFFLEEENERPFLRDQYQRVEASCDWLMGEHYKDSELSIPYLGQVKWEGGTEFSFDNFIPDGEDFRGSWRTVMNAVWHENPTYTWNPNTHQVDLGITNSFEQDMGKRYAKFLKNNQGEPWNNPCRLSSDLKPLSFKGPYTLLNGYTPQGDTLGAFPLNWIHGTGAPSAIVGQDFRLMGEMFRHCVIAWDASSASLDNNLNSTPIYFHEWFRLAGMLTLSGNFHAPSNMKRVANLKVYHEIDKTFAFTGDEVNYTISYRNYGALDALDARVAFAVPANFEFVSATEGGVQVGDSIVWDLTTVPGFKTGGLEATRGEFDVRFKIGENASGRYCTTAKISCSNGSGWESNEYPNKITAVMERNCVDVIQRSLVISKTADRKEFNPGQEVTYEIEFENSSEAGWLNGGRPNVRVSFAHDELPTPESDQDMALKFRLMHDADEAYIDYGNYRVSYFMNDPSIKCYVGNADCPNGWDLQATIAQGVVPENVTITHELLTPGTDENGSWNQRIAVKFSPQLATITQHLQQYAGSPDKVHEGGLVDLRSVWRMFNTSNSNLNWTDDWSWDATKSDIDGGLYFPVGDDYSDPENLGVLVDSWHTSACQKTTNVMRKVLVEEWDGYVWRRVLGNGPVPGRDIENVVVCDTLPQGLTWIGFTDNEALGIDASYDPASRVIKWSKPKMLVGEKGTLSYKAVVNFPSGSSCSTAEEEIRNNAWIAASSESPISESDTIIVTCEEVVICPDANSLMLTSDKTSYLKDEIASFNITYTQDIGTRVQVPNDEDWQAISGIPTLDVNAGVVDLSADWSLKGTIYKYSHGTDGVIEGRLEVSPDQEVYGIVFRENEGTYSSVNFKVISAGIEVSVVDESGVTLQTLLAAGALNPFNFKIELDGDLVRVWVNDVNSVDPFLSVSGLSVKAGYSGVISVPGSGGTLSNWQTHLDSGFDLEIKSPIQPGLTTIENITGTNGETGSVVGTDVIWDLGEGPVLAGTMFNLSWDAKVDVCQEYTHKAFVNSLGVGEEVFGDCYETACGSETQDPPVANFSADELEICVGETVRFTDLSTGTISTYTWSFEDGTPNTVPGKGPHNVSFNTSGVKTIELMVDGPDGEDTETKTTYITVNPAPTAALQAGDIYCKEELDTKSLGITVTGGEAPYNVSYTYNNGEDGTVSITTGLTGEIENTSGTGIGEGEYALTSIVDANGCSTLITDETASIETYPALVLSKLVAPCTEDDETTITGTLTGGTLPYTLDSSLPAGGVLTGANFSATFNATEAVSYSYAFSDASGCMSNKDTLAGVRSCNCGVEGKLTLKPTSSSVICEGKTALLEVDATGGSTGNYEIILTNGIQDISPDRNTGSLYEFTVDKAGIYSIKTITDECEGIGLNTVEIVVPENTEIVMDLDPDTQNICPNTSVNLVVEAKGENLDYQWFRNNSPILGATDEFFSKVVSNQETDGGIYKVEVKGLCGDRTSNEVLLWVDEATTWQTNLSTAQIEKCEGEELLLSVEVAGTGPFNFTWNTPGPETSDSAIFTIPSLDFADEGSYSVQVEGKCNSIVSETAVLSVKVPSPRPVKDTTICENERITLTGQVNTADGLSYQWTRNGVAEGELNKTVLEGVSLEGIYSFIVGGSACVSNNTPDVRVIVLDNPSVEAGSANTVIEEGGTIIQLNGEHSGQSSLWTYTSNNGNTLIEGDVTSPKTSFISTEMGEYRFTLTSKLGECTASDFVVVRLFSEIVAPNVFTPNGDGENDLFSIRGLEAYPDARVTIFNRWGINIYETADYPANEWGGSGVPDGVYYYLVNLNSEINPDLVHTGVIHVLRK